MTGEKLVIIISVLIGTIAADNVHEMQVDESGPLKLTKFMAKNCSSQSNRQMYFEKLILTPDPIKFGSTEMVSVVLNILKDLGAAGTKLSAHIELYGKAGDSWMDYCPLIGQEYCHIDDFCSAIKNIPVCPLKYIGLEQLGCACPFRANKYGNEKKVPVQIPPLSIGIAGTFNFTLTFIQDGQPVGCTNTVFCLNKCS